MHPYLYIFAFLCILLFFVFFCKRISGDIYNFIRTCLCMFTECMYCDHLLVWWTIAAQDEGEWRRTAEQEAEHFVAKWIVAEKAKAGLRHAVVCWNVTGRTKERIAQSNGY